MARALVDGEVSREHVDVAVATLNRIPKALKIKMIPDGGGDGGGRDRAEGGCRTGAQVIDEVLTGQARHLPPSTIDRLGRQIRHRLDPDRAERFDADAVQRRMCSIGSDFAGMGMYRLILDPVTHVQVRALIARFAGPGPQGRAVSDDGEVVQVSDTRTLGQRQADAVTDLIMAGAAAAGASGDQHPDRAASAGEPPRADHEADPDGSAEHDMNRDDIADDDTDHDDPGGEHDPDAVDDAYGLDDAYDLDGVDAEGARAAGRERRWGRRLPPGVFMAKPCAGVEISVIATVDQLAAAFGAGDPAAAGAGLARMGLAGLVGPYPGATIDPAVLARLACDSPIRRILLDEQGAVLHHGRARRFASAAQKRALAARDGGCVIPGCHAPPEWCQVHHVIPWEHGGVTDIDAMLLLCGRHHTAHHAGIYDIQMRDGVPWVRRPAWQDPARSWLRNTTHDHARLAEATARTLTHQPLLPWDQCQAPPDAA
jgi:hypothetical protein